MRQKSPKKIGTSLIDIIALMHDFKSLWTEMAHKNGMPYNISNSSTIIVDDVLLYTSSLDNMVILLTAACTIATKYNLTWKLKNANGFLKLLNL